MSKAISDIIKISAGKGGNAALAFALSVIIARELGAGDFGLFTLSMSVLVVTMELTASEAVDNGMVRFAAKYMGTEPGRAKMFMRAAFKFKAIAAAVVLAAGAALTWPFVNHILNRPELGAVVFYGLAGGCGASLWRFMLAALQSSERFSAYVAVNLAPNVLKVLAVGLLVFLNTLELSYALMLNVAAAAFGVAVGLAFLRTGFLSAHAEPAKQRAVAGELFQFSKWMIVANLCFAVYSRVDVLMLSYFVSPDVVGVYSVALTLVLAIELLYVSVLTGLYPSASRLVSRQEFKAHIKRTLKISLSTALIVSPLYFFAEPLVNIIFSSEFSESAALFQVLLVGVLFTLAFNPLLLVFLARDKPQVVMKVAMGLLAMSFLGNLLAIPAYGALGTAVVVSATKVAGGVALMILSYLEVSRRDGWTGEDGG